MNKGEIPLISVVVPIYKVEKYLDRCINSVINQSYTNLEIILVNDGSPDMCPQLCNIWSKRDKRICVIHKENGGLSSARNAGIDFSHGDFITFIDSDDWVSKDYIEYLYSLMNRYTADLAVGGHIVVDSFSECFSCLPYEEKVLSGRDFLLKVLKVNTQENVQYAWGKLYKNFRNTDLRFPNGLIDEDVPTTFKYASECSNVVVSTKAIYAYYENKESILRKKFSLNRFDLIKVWEIVADYASRKCDKEIADYAMVGFYRANFGVLCNISTEEIDEDYIEQIKEEEKKALQVVKDHKNELLGFPMPLSRKIFVVGFSISYKLSKRLLRRLRMRN